MPISQESLLLISIPNCAMTVSNEHTLKNTLSKGSGWSKEILLWSFEWNESVIKLNFVLNSTAYTQKKSSNSFNILGSKDFHL